MPYKDPEKARECKRRWRNNNLEKARASALAHYYKSGGYKAKPQTEKRKAYMKDYNATYHEETYQGDIRDKKRTYNRERRYTNAEAIRNAELKTHYGITLADYKTLLEVQDGLCAICRKPETYKLNGKLIALAVDHCHRTNIVRGLFCGACNKAIGLMKEDIDRLYSAIKYLETHAEVDIPTSRAPDLSANTASIS